MSLTTQDSKLSQLQLRSGITALGLIIAIGGFSGCHLLAGDPENPSTDAELNSIENQTATTTQGAHTTTQKQTTAHGQNDSSSQKLGSNSSTPQALSQAQHASNKVSPKESDQPIIPLSYPTDPQVVARVNKHEIKLSEFEHAFARQTHRFKQRKQALSPERISRMRRATLQGLVDRALFEQHLDQRQIKLTKQEHQSAFDTYYSRFRRPQTFQLFLKRNGQTEEDLRAQLSFEARVNKGLRDQFLNSVSVKDEDIKAFYNQNVDTQFTTPAEVRVSHLLVAAPTSAGKRVIKRQKRAATKLYRKARKMNAQEFEQFVREHSDDLQTRAQGGDLNYFKQEGLPMISREFEEAASKLKIGEVSDPIRSPMGYHIIRLTRRQPPQVRVSHLLLPKDTSAERIEEIKKRARVEPFAKLVLELSKDETTRLRRGELGFIHHQRKHRYGDAFKDACLAGKAGELIGPVKSPQGQHLIFVTGYRPERLAVSHILVRVPKRAKRSQRKAARAKIDQISKELKQAKGNLGSLFVRLATKHSEHNTRLRGGDLGNFYVGGHPKISHSFEEAAFKGKVGQLMKPVLSPYGWHLIFVQDQRPQVVKTYDEAKEGIEKDLSTKHLRRAKFRLLKQLRDEAQIELILTP